MTLGLKLPSGGLCDGVVLLRSWAISDLDAVAQATADPEIVRRNRLPQPFDAAQWLAAMPAERLRGEALRLLITDASSGDLIGAVSLSGFEWENRSANLGYWIVASKRGRGFAGRATALICSWAFGALGVARVTAETDVDNIASRRMLEKAGFISDKCDGSVITFHIEAREVAMRGSN